MIYECPRCSAPQEAGVTSCPHCRAQFDGPVPDDAILPPAPPPRAAEVRPEPVAEPQSAPAAEAGSGPIVEEVMPPAPPPPAYQPPPLPYSPPAVAAASPMRPPLSGLTKALLFAFPIVLVLVLGGVYFASTLNSQGDVVPTPVAARQPAPAAAPAPEPVGSPLLLQGGTNTTSAENDPRSKALVGRWETKSQDFYVFNSNGTGSRGNTAQQQKEQPFLWGLVQNRLMLYMDTNEMLRFNAGPDDNTIFLGPQTGRFIQYRRARP